MDFNENEEQFFKSILDAIEKNLPIEQLIVEMPVNIEANVDEEKAVVKHHALTSKRGKLNWN